MMTPKQLILTAFLISLLTLAYVNAHQASPGNAAITVTRRGSQQPYQAPVDNFTGSVRVTPLFPATEPSRVAGASVTFEPGARTNWHTHPVGQTLIVTAGTGWVQQ